MWFLLCEEASCDKVYMTVQVCSQTLQNEGEVRGSGVIKAADQDSKWQLRPLFKLSFICRGNLGRLGF